MLFRSSSLPPPPPPLNQASVGLTIWWSSWFDVVDRGGTVVVDYGGAVLAMDRGGTVLAVTKPSWVSWVGGAHGFDVVADVVD